MYMWRTFLGIVATIMQGAMGLNLLMMNTPDDKINVHFLGGFMLVIAGMIYILMMWEPRRY